MLLEDALVIFIKYPQAGLVKTRLAKEIGKEKAALLYRLFAEATLSRTYDKAFSRIVFYSPAEKKREIRDWLGPGLDIYPQEGESLGDRLASAFRLAFKNGAKRVIVIGTDSPTLDRQLIAEAFRRLKRRRCVLGPALDGGYYLLGLASFHKEIFEGLNWGESDVLERTQYKLRESGIEFDLLEPCLDVDTAGDIRLLKERLQQNLKINPVGLKEIMKILNGSWLQERCLSSHHTNVLTG